MAVLYSSGNLRLNGESAGDTLRHFVWSYGIHMPFGRAMLHKNLVLHDLSFPCPSVLYYLGNRHFIVAREG